MENMAVSGLAGSNENENRFDRALNLINQAVGMLRRGNTKGKEALPAKFSISL